MVTNCKTLKEWEDFWTTCKNLKEWEDFGLLAELPEDRKEMVVFCYNTAIKWLTDDLAVTHKKQETFEVLILPTFYRIAKIVDLTEAQVLEICKEFRISWLKFDPTELVNVDDPEAHFIASFAEMKINQYKK
jgi:hypothetical protein